MRPPKRPTRIGDVQKTLLIPLYGRAIESRKRRGMIDDPRSVEMVDSLDYDFSAFDGTRSASGAVLRTLVFDAWVREFLERHPGGTVVEIGTGLNTRFERLDNGTAHWFDLDLPDVIELRRAFFDDTDRRRMLAVSVADPSWVQAVSQSPGPYFLAAEAVLPYLQEDVVRSVFDLVADGLPGALLATDTTASRMVDRQDGSDVLGGIAAQWHWRCDDPRQVETWREGVELLDSRTFASLPEPVRRGLPPADRLLFPVLGLVKRKEIQAYRLNLYRLGGRGAGPAAEAVPPP